MELCCGSYTDVVPPVPIPNTEVKYVKADDSRIFPAKVGSRHKITSFFVLVRDEIRQGEENFVLFFTFVFATRKLGGRREFCSLLYLRFRYAKTRWPMIVGFFRRKHAPYQTEGFGVG